MVDRVPADVCTDVVVQSTPTPIAVAGSPAHGQLTFPTNASGFGFKGSLLAAKGNTAAITITGTYGTMTLAAGETTGPIEDWDLGLILVSCGTANQVLHVAGNH